MQRVFGCLLVAAICASAQPGHDSGSSERAAPGWQSSWEKEVRESGALSETGRSAEAEARLRDLLGKMEGSGAKGYPVACVLHYLGAACRFQCRYAEAEAAFRRALRELGSGGEEDRGRSWILLTFAQLYNEIGRPRDAERLLVDALDIQRHLQPPDKRLLVLLFSHLGTAYRLQRRYADAETKLREALAIAEHDLGPHDPAGATVLNDLAVILDSVGRTKDAIPLAERAVRIWEQGARTTHPDFALGLGNLAGFLTKSGRYEEAERLFVKALSIQRDALREQHPSTGYMLRNYSVLLQKTGRKREAKKVAKRSQAILSDQQGQQASTIDVTALAGRH